MKTDIHTVQASPESYRLSPQQRHLWRLQETQAADLFFVSCRVRVEGRVDVYALRTAIRQVARRHDILRAGFQILRGEDSPSQVIGARDRKPEIVEQHLTNLSGQEQAEWLASLSGQMREPSPTAQTRPPFSVRLLHVNDEHCEMLIRVSALCSDAAGLRSIVCEIAQLYGACAAGHELNLPEPVQYTDVARVFNELLEEEDSRLGTTYWREQNLSATERGQLGFEKRLAASTRFAPEVFEQQWEGATARRLKTAADACGATIEQWLLACWKVLLWRLTGQTEVVVGVSFANRNYDLDDAVGLFNRYIPLRSYFTGDLPFVEVLKRVGATVEESREWEDYFSWEHVAASGSDGDSPDASYCDFAFDYDEAQTMYRSADVAFTIEEQYACLDRFRLKLACMAEPGGASLQLCLHYDSSQLAASDVSQIAAYLRKLLTGTLEEPLCAVARLPLMDEAQRSELLARMRSRESASHDASATLHNLFARQVALTPDAHAVTYERATLSYAELDVRANRLAHYLRRLGVGAESRVALLLEPSDEMVVAILGVLKAGGCYVPLDAHHPAERLAYMLSDSATGIVLTQESLRQRLDGCEARVVCLDSQRARLAGESADNLGLRLDPENAAYIIYTSGSTGQPKGVIVTHRNATRLFAVAAPLFDFRREDVWTMFHSYAFDFSVWELWGALLHGGRLVVVPYWVSRSPEAFRQLLVEQRVTMLNQTPSAFRQLMTEDERIEAGGVSVGLSLRAVIFGGEALEMGSLRGWVRRHGDERPRLVNMYGITETTVHVTYAEVNAEEVEAGGASRIGVGLADLSVYVLDVWGEVVPQGVAGELYIGGEGVARGYLARPALTAQRFLPDPYSLTHGARMYRTGDRARYRPDGQLEFLGRIDNQVKVRGYRIELGEVEAALRAVSGVREAVVEARGTDSEKRLVAYVVWDEAGAGTQRSVGEVRERLRERLPEYMVPSVYVELGQLPLTANGKVDRRALPEAEQRGSGGREHEGARTGVEELLCGIWAEVLGVEQVGIHDNFFDLGGDSILSIQIVARAARAGLALTPKSLFEHQTVAKLAASATPRAESPSRVGPATGPVAGLVPLTPIQHRFFERHQAAPNHYNQSVLLASRDPLRRDALERAVGALLYQHDALRLRFVEADGGKQRRQWYADYEEGEAVQVVSCHDLSGLDEDEVLAALDEKGGQLQASMNLSEGPLLRVACFDLGERLGWRLLLAVHHLVVDGVSWRILLEDMMRAYGQAMAGEEVELGEKTSSYGEWARRLEEYAASEQMEDEADYWVGQCETLNRLRGEGMGAWQETAEEARKGGEQTVVVSLTEEQTKGLLQETGRAYGTRVTEVLLAALLVTWAEWNGEPVLGVDVEAHGREAELIGGVDVTRTVGWFTAIYPLVLDLPRGWDEGSRDYGAVLKWVKERVRNVPGGGIGYGVLRYLGGDEAVRRKLAASGAARVSFNYLGQFDTVLGGSGEFAAAVERAGRAHADESEREYELGVAASVRGARLHVNVNYDAERCGVEEAERLANGYGRVLGEIVEHCRRDDVGGYTPSDFPLLQLGQSQLDEAFEELEFE